MKITNIKIKNFRNYEHLDINFNSNLNVFIGNNAQGKTNLIESLYVLGITKSHRMYNDKKLIRNGSKFSKLTGTIISNNNTLELEVIINEKGKSVKINNNVTKKISEYISKFTIIVFCPDDLEMIKGSPSIRRRFINIELGQINNKYLIYLNDYNKLLKNRNEYLKQNTIDTIDKTYIKIIDEQISVKASTIYEMRRDFINKIGKTAKKIYEKMSKGDSLDIEYQTNIEIFNTTAEILQNKIYEKINSSLKRDLFLGTTINGPHRDDLCFYINKHEIKEYGSQGQQRLAILSLKLAELEIFKEIKKEYPILLLDDVFSELDEEKKNNLVTYMKKGIQTFITTTDLNNIDKELLKTADIYEIKDGVLEKRILN